MIHIEAPDETGHEGDYRKKIQAINDLDNKVVGPLINLMENKYDEYKICIVSDHPTPCELRTHSYEYVPFLIFDSRLNNNNHGKEVFSEKAANESGIVEHSGHELLFSFFQS